MKRTYSKDWCQGFCRTCGTSCADQCEDVHELKEEVERVKLEASTDLISQERRLGARNEILEKENARFREALINCRVERDEPDTVKFLVDEAFDVLEGGGLEVRGTSDPFLRCDKCGQSVTAEMDNKRHCDLLDRLNADRARHVKSLLREKARLREALKSITERGKGNGGAACVTTETLRSIARAALEGKE